MASGGELGILLLDLEPPAKVPEGKGEAGAGREERKETRTESKTSH